MPGLISAPASSSRSSSQIELDRAVQEVGEHASEFARLPVGERVKLLELCMGGLAASARRWVSAAAAAKQVEPGSIGAAEEWGSGPFIAVRGFRLLAATLKSIAATGAPPLGAGFRTRGDGRLEVDLIPTSALDRVVWTGFRARAVLEPGISEASAHDRQASFYRNPAPAGRVALVLGAGNNSSIPAADVLTKMFEQGQVCILKMSPVNEWLGPILETALAPLVQPGYLRIVYGGASEGAYLAGHDGIDTIHITGSAATYDAIVWGPPGEERDRRKAAGQPISSKEVSAELGNVSPLIVVPGAYSQGQLWMQARAVATQVAHNASFNCNATKVLVLPRSWPQRQAFTDLLQRALAQVPTRAAYYPGAQERYQRLVEGRQGVQTFGAAAGSALPWTYVSGLDAQNAREPLFTTEPFCGIVSEVLLDSSDPDSFLEEACRFANERLWGTLNASIVIDPKLPGDSGYEPVWRSALDSLRYGTVAVNAWPAISYALMSPPWGGHPSSQPADIQSGLGWVHNTYLLEGVEKVVFEGAIKPPLKPAWHYDNRKTAEIGEALVELEASPSPLKLPRLMVLSARG